MTSLRLPHALALAGLFALSGCPSATTLETDGGGGGDAAMDDAANADDAGGGGADGGGADTGTTASWASCAQTSECGLASVGCCSPCGMPTLADLEAINLSQRDAHYAEVCPVPTPCPRCATGINPNLVATCQSARCTAYDLSTMPLSVCNTDADCVIRYANCCSCSGDPSEVVSVRADAEAAVEALLCDGGGCALDCVPRMDPGFVAACNPTTHHCYAMITTIGP